MFGILTDELLEQLGEEYIKRNDLNGVIPFDLYVDLMLYIPRKKQGWML